MAKIKYLVFHHSATPSSIPADKAEASFNATHKARNWGTKQQPAWAKMSSMGWYIQYQYVIYGDGQVRQYRRDDEPGWHASNLTVNNSGIGVCYSLNGDAELPTPQQKLAGAKLGAQLVEKYGIKMTNVVPHRTFNPSKSCPGTKIAESWYRTVIADYIKQYGGATVKPSPIPAPAKPGVKTALADVIRTFERYAGRKVQESDMETMNFLAAFPPDQVEAKLAKTVQRPKHRIIISKKSGVGYLVEAARSEAELSQMAKEIGVELPAKLSDLPDVEVL